MKKILVIWVALGIVVLGGEMTPAKACDWYMTEEESTFEDSCNPIGDVFYYTVVGLVGGMALGAIYHCQWVTDESQRREAKGLAPLSPEEVSKSFQSSVIVFGAVGGVSGFLVGTTKAIEFLLKNKPPSYFGGFEINEGLTGAPEVSTSLEMGTGWAAIPMVYPRMDRLY